MPRIIRLTWRNSSRSWQKKYRGKVYYFSFTRSQYSEAWTAWLKKKSEIDQHEKLVQLSEQEDELEALWQRWRANAVALIEASEPEGGTEKLAIAQRSLAVAVEIADAIQNHGSQSPPPKVFDFEPPLELDDAADLRPSHRKFWKRAGLPANIEPKKSVGHNLDEYLAEKTREAEAGQASAGTLRNNIKRLRNFEEWIEPERDASTIEAKTLADYRSFLLTRYTSAATAKSDLVAVKAFLLWLYQRGVLQELPRNFTDKSLSIKVKTKEVEIFGLQELRELLAKATGRIKLYLLLAVNCGYLSADISHLRHSEVDWENGRITRRRTKTKDRSENVPKVTYELFPETFALLKEFRSTHADLVLVNQHGSPLAHICRKDGKNIQTDTISKAVRAFRLQNGLSADLPMKNLRTTAASMINNEPRFRGLGELFLGHAPRSIAAKHYFRVDEHTLDEPLAWLREQLGFFGERTITHQKSVSAS